MTFIYGNDFKNRQEWARAAAQSPCARCGGKTEAVYAYRPENPEKFDLPPGYGIYIPLCGQCWAGGNVDIDFLEDMLRYCGQGKDAAAVLDGEMQNRGH